MAIAIEPLLEADTMPLIKLYYRAFENSMVPFLFSSPPSELSYILMASERARILSKPRTRAFKAIDTTSGQMLGAAYFKVAPDAFSQEELDSDKPIFQRFAPEQKVDVWKAFGKRLGECYAKIVGVKPCVEVALLIVEPAWQGKGVGSKLLEWGCQEADRLGCISYVEASDVGIRAYEKAGFETVCTIDFDTTPWGHESKLPVDTIMIRKPKSV